MGLLSIVLTNGIFVCISKTSICSNCFDIIVEICVGSQISQRFGKRNIRESIQGKVLSYLSKIHYKVGSIGGKVVGFDKM
jgi:hypothetical protein